MTQKATYTREMIVEAAYQLTREAGWAAVTARNIAAKLGSSTMPLYSSLRSMEEIEKEVRSKAEECMHEFQRRPYAAGDPLLSSAVGYVAFARDEKNLFRFLYVDRPVTGRQAPEAGKAVDVEKVGGVVDLADQAQVAMKDFRVLKSWAFTHGLSSLISSGVLDLPDKTIARLLLEVGSAIYASETTITKGGNR
jgi:AcrR family transcriptional regulator